jgi:hypothetical protein
VNAFRNCLGGRALITQLVFVSGSRATLAGRAAGRSGARRREAKALAGIRPHAINCAIETKST